MKSILSGGGDILRIIAITFFFSFFFFFFFGGGYIFGFENHFYFRHLHFSWLLNPFLPFNLHALSYTVYLHLFFLTSIFFLLRYCIFFNPWGFIEAGLRCLVFFFFVCFLPRNIIPLIHSRKNWRGICLYYWNYSYICIIQIL